MNKEQVKHVLHLAILMYPSLSTLWSEGIANPQGKAENLRKQQVGGTYFSKLLQEEHSPLNTDLSQAGIFS